MTWFERLTGFREESPDQVRRNLAIDETILRSLVTGQQWQYGRLRMPSLNALRRISDRKSAHGRRSTIREVVADVQTLHCDRENAGAMFQVASQFNLLEMTSPRIAPEDGVGRYEFDRTQGPACAIAAGAGTIFRNYFVQLGDQIGQSRNRQIDCLADIGEALGNRQENLWRMINGYAIPAKNGLEAINQHLSQLDTSQRDHLRGLLRIGLQIDTQVTLGDSGHCVTQVYCSAMPVAYTGFPTEQWAPFATLILEAAYEATLCAAVENASRTSNNRLFLTLLGGGAFGNDERWILSSIDRACRIHQYSGLDIAVVSFGRSNPSVARWIDKIR